MNNLIYLKHALINKYMNQISTDILLMSYLCINNKSTLAVRQVLGRQPRDHREALDSLERRQLFHQGLSVPLRGMAVPGPDVWASRVGFDKYRGRNGVGVSLLDEIANSRADYNECEHTSMRVVVFLSGRETSRRTGRCRSDP